MADVKGKSEIMLRRVVVLAILLFFFSVPHTLEDFATGEPAKAGVPAPVLSMVVAIIFALQALGLYWLGGKQRRGLFVIAGVGLFWPLASGVAPIARYVSAFQELLESSYGLTP